MLVLAVPRQGVWVGCVLSRLGVASVQVGRPWLACLLEWMQMVLWSSRTLQSLWLGGSNCGE